MILLRESLFSWAYFAGRCVDISRSRLPLYRVKDRAVYDLAVNHLLKVPTHALVPMVPCILMEPGRAPAYGIRPPSLFQGHS